MSNTSPLLDPAAVQRLAAELSARNNWSRDALLAVRRGASLTDLPILTKTTLMDQWDRIVTDSRVRLRDVESHLAGPRCGELFLDEYRVFATGGTTCERAIVAYDRAAWLDIMANVLRWVGIMGVGPDARLVGIGAPTPLHVTNRAFAELQAGPRRRPTPLGLDARTRTGREPQCLSAGHDLHLCIVCPPAHRGAGVRTPENPPSANCVHRGSACLRRAGTGSKYVGCRDRRRRVD